MKDATGGIHTPLARALNRGAYGHGAGRHWGGGRNVEVFVIILDSRSRVQLGSFLSRHIFTTPLLAPVTSLPIFRPSSSCLSLLPLLPSLAPGHPPDDQPRDISSGGGLLTGLRAALVEHLRSHVPALRDNADIPVLKAWLPSRRECSGKQWRKAERRGSSKV